MKKFVFGIMVLGLGVLLLLSNFGYLPYYLREIFFSWEMILIAIGIINLASRESKVLGLILISVGGFFLLDEIFVLSFDFYKLFWPVLLIVIGGSLILFGGRIFNHRNWHQQHSRHSNVEGVLDEVNIFGGNKKRITTDNFKGGEIVNIFGGSEIDLTQANLEEGRNVLELTCIFGGTTLIVPSDWNIQTEMVSILGGFGDKRTIIKKPLDVNTVLVIKGVAIFGGGEIKSY